MIVQAYVFFDGRCDEAIAFYQQALSAKVEMLMRFKDNPDPNAPPMGEMADKVMHASIKIGDTSLMISDGHCVGTPKFEGFSLTITADTAADAERLFNALLEGGTIVQPLTQTFFSEKFGMLMDKFGLMWMVLVAQQQ